MYCRKAKRRIKRIITHARFRSNRQAAVFPFLMYDLSKKRCGGYKIAAPTAAFVCKPSRFSKNGKACFSQKAIFHPAAWQ